MSKFQQIGGNRILMLIAFFACCYVLTFAMPQSVSFSYAQVSQGKKSDIPGASLSVVETIYGVTKNTGLIVTFVNVNNSTTAQFLNATSYDVSDKKPKDGIIEIYIPITAKKVSVGSEFKACVFVLNSVKLLCHTGRNSPADRSEFVDFLLNP